MIRRITSGITRISPDHSEGTLPANHPPPTEVKVPFQDFIAPYHELKAELDEAYFRFMESGWLVLGKEVSSFEEEYAAYCEAGHCVGVAHGLDALHLALKALDCGPGDEVIVPSNTYIATWLAVTYAGGIRGLADLDLVKALGKGRVDATVGSALDIFGGDLPGRMARKSTRYLSVANRTRLYQRFGCHE